MKIITRILVGAAGLALCAQALAQVTFYEGEGFRGRAFTVSRGAVNLQRAGFNDRASSVIVDRGRWEVCEDAGFGGRCVLLRPGNYGSLRQMGLDNRVSSARLVTDQGRYDHYTSPEPVATADYEWRRRANERVYEAPVISVHAVMGPPEQHCWTERDQVARSNPSAAGGVVGGIIGGILGHQIVGGRSQGAATVGGAIAGAAIGANAGRTTEYGAVERKCETVDRDGPPDYWDVVYRYRNVDHHVQMSAPPGRTISVNRDGEPRQ